jgi:anti-sigma factor ChrR (cupin superfamily)
MIDSDPSAPLHGDLARRVVVDTAKLAWTPSPSRTVWRKRLHRVGPAESGQVTSIVRYEAGASFPAHEHPEGEEILVLDGVFSDEHGDWPAGTWLLNQEGFRHAPFSREGCLLFVKLRQAAGLARQHVELRTDQMPWRACEFELIERKLLAEDDAFPDSTWLERWWPGASPGVRRLAGGAEIFVLEGCFSDEAGEYEEGSWLRLPAHSSQHPNSHAGCLLYVNYGGVGGLRSE